MGGGGVKRPAPSLGPHIVIDTSIELFSHLYVLKTCDFKLHLQFFSLQEYRIAAILKNGGHFQIFGG